MENFTDWLARELNERGWSVPEAARRSKKGGYRGVSASMIYKVINGHAEPGQRLFDGIARAFDVPVEDVMRRAGVLPSVPPEPPDVVDLEEARRLFNQLPSAQRKAILAQMRALVAMRERLEGEEAEVELKPGTAPV